MYELSSFVYGGPNRRSDLTVIEKRLELSSAELGRFAQRDPAGWYEVLENLHGALAVTPGVDGWPDGVGSNLLPDQISWLCANTCLSLQRAAGHPVGQKGLIASSSTNECHFFYEYEEPETGQEAGEIALEALGLLWGDADPGRRPESEENATAALIARINRFLCRARPKAMPADSRAIYDAAIDRGIPCFRMDRPPYDPVEGDFRLRYNGLFRLGHGFRQHTVDGTFCVSRSEPVFSLVRDRVALMDRLEKLSIPLPGTGEVRWCQSAIKAGRIADRTGYPVYLRTDTRGTSHAAARLLPDRESVMRAATVALQYGSRVLVQPRVPGREYKLVVAGDSVVAAFERTDDGGKGSWRSSSGFHPSVEALACDLAQSFSVGLLALTVVSPDISSPLEASAGAVVDVELAPRLDQLLAADDPRLQQAAGAFVDWIIPDARRARIPVVAVTGTNGKTTTCRMLDSIMAATGYLTGLACSDGSFVAGKAISQYEDGYLPGHVSVLDNPSVEAAVLESTRGAAGTTGLGFDRCDVAVCLNVTADHLNDFVGIRSVRQLARLKRTIVERGDAVVLNADDRNCREMVEHLDNRRVGLVSLSGGSADDVSGSGGECPRAVVDVRDHRNWLSIEHDGRRIPVVAENEVPLTFRGAARHNTANALHAMLAAYLMDVPVDAIATGLCRLNPDYESLPGRLTFYRELDFDVCMDYAHNPDGVRKLCRFIGKLQVTGRRIFCFSCSNANSDDFIRETAAAAAGSFDHYICKNFSLMYDREPTESPRLLREGLISAGVESAAITCIEDQSEAIDAALDMGRPGDLVVIIGGKYRDRLWQQIVERRRVR